MVRGSRLTRLLAAGREGLLPEEGRRRVLLPDRAELRKPGSFVFVGWPILPRQKPWQTLGEGGQALGLAHRRIRPWPSAGFRCSAIPAPLCELDRLRQITPRHQGPAQVASNRREWEAAKLKRLAERLDRLVDSAGVQECRPQLVEGGRVVRLLPRGVTELDERPIPLTVVQECVGDRDTHEPVGAEVLLGGLEFHFGLVRPASIERR